MVNRRVTSEHPSFGRNSGFRRVGDPANDVGTLRAHAAVLGAGMAEVAVVDGVPTLTVDELFEAARQQALAGFDDIDRDRARHRHPSHPQRRPG
jgi:hypothetical protein